MRELFQCELSYLKSFCLWDESDDLVRFFDPQIPDMYSHNLTYIKEHVPACALPQIISREITAARTSGRTFLNVMTDVRLDSATLQGLPLTPSDHCLYDYYVFGRRDTGSLRSREDCEMAALSADLCEAALELDLRANGEDMGEDFVRRRFARRSQVYLAAGGVDHFLCFHEDDAVGHADLFISDGVAKIEDVDIAPDRQRKGFGTTMLKAMIELAWSRGAETVYLITDHDDTAREMYEKTGFVRVAQKAEWLFSLNP